MELLLNDLTTLSEFQHCAVPPFLPATETKLFKLLLNLGSTEINFKMLRPALEDLFLDETGSRMDCSRIRSGLYGLKSVVLALRRLKLPVEKEDITSCNWWLERLVYSAQLQSWNYRMDTSGLRSVMAALVVCAGVNTTRILNYESTVPIEIQLLICPWLRLERPSYSVAPFSLKRSASPELHFEKRDEKRSCSPGIANLRISEDFASSSRSTPELSTFHLSPDNMTTPTVSLSNSQQLSVTSSTMSRTPSNHSSTSKASISTEKSFYLSHSNLCILIDAALGTSNQLPSSPSHHNPSANSNSNLSNSNSTFFWSTLTQSLHSLPSINYLSSYELLEFPRSSYLGSIAPTSNSNEFIRAQVCVTSCGYKSKIATKPIRIREHFSRCNFRKKHFEGENIDHLGRLATLEICALREKNTMNELASKNSLGRK